MTTIPTINNIDYLVSLIETSTNPEETYKNNLELWKNFYDIYTVSDVNILDINKLLIIIRFCFEYEQDEMGQYFRRDMLEILYFFVRKNFWELEPNVTKSIIRLIGENFVALENNFVGTHFLCTFHSICDFIGMKVEELVITKQVIEHRLKDKNVFICMLESGLLLRAFNSDFSRYLKFLDGIDYIAPEYIREKIEEQFEYHLKKEEPGPLLNLIIRNNKSPLWESYLTDSKRKEILQMAISRPIIDLTNEQIKFFLNLMKNSNLRNEIGSSLLFVFENNCAQLINNDFEIPKGKDIDKEEITIICSQLGICKQLGIDIEKVGSISIKDEDDLNIKLQKAYNNSIYGYQIDMKDAIKILKLFLKKEINVDVITMIIVLRSIVIHLKKQLNIVNNGVYLYWSNKSTGRHYGGTDIVAINALDILRCYHENNPSIFELIEMLLHEISHNYDNTKQRLGFWDITIYEENKQTIIKEYDYSFRKKNYMILKGEMKARLAGINQLQKFVEDFLPEYLDELQEKIIDNLRKEKEFQKANASNKVKVLGMEVEFQTAFDTFIRYNPNILEEHPILNLEYYSNGIPKTAEDIWLSRTEQNKDLIDGILNARYPDPTNKPLAK